MTAVAAKGDVSATGGSARSQAQDLRERSWRPQPVLSFAIVVVAFFLPTVAAVAAVQVVAHLVRRPDALSVLVVWFAGLVAVASGTLWSVNRLAQRLLPMAAMLRFSLVFPDSAPSRFSMALRTGSGRALERALQQGTNTIGEFSTSRDSASLVVGLIAAVSTHDRLTRGHSERVRAYADLIGQELGLDAEDRNKLHWAALLHDVGKLAVPAAILNKSERLTAEEWDIIRGHPGASARWLEPVRAWLGDWALAASEHHERYDGHGYPSGLKGDDISLAGRIVAVADAFDVMTSTRSYKKPLPAAQARVELTNNAGTQFDPKVVRAFLSISLGKLRLIVGPLAGLSALSGLVSVGGVASGAAAAIATTAVAASALTAAPPAPHAAPHPIRATTNSTSEVTLPARSPSSSVSGEGHTHGTTVAGVENETPTTVPNAGSSGTPCALLPAKAPATKSAPSASTRHRKPIAKNAASPLTSAPTRTQQDCGASSHTAWPPTGTSPASSIPAHHGGGTPTTLPPAPGKSKHHGPPKPKPPAKSPATSTPKGKPVTNKASKPTPPAPPAKNPKKRPARP